jgi:hypothetical protein
MIYKNIQSTALLLLFLSVFQSVYSQAVVTLVVPVGARQAGMGETAVGLADDVFATYWNPAGLAFGPLADEWKLALSGEERKRREDLKKRQFTTLTSKGAKRFLSKSTVWSGTEDGLYRYNGKEWQDYYIKYLDDRETLRDVVKDYSGAGEGLDSLVNIVKRFNKIRNYQDEKSRTFVKLPYSLVFQGLPVTALLVDKSQRVWVGTSKGLFRFDGSRWRSFTKHAMFSKEDKAKKQSITALALRKGEVWVGTEGGLFRYRKNKFTRRGEKQLPLQNIVAIATHPNAREVYVAHGSGVARYTPAKGQGQKAKWKLFGTDNGLLAPTINGLELDKYGHVWVGHPKGVSHYTLLEWKRVTFNKQEVRGVDLDEEGVLWIGTNKGVWKHTPAHVIAKGKSGKGEKGEWFHYHTGNALKDNDDRAIQTDGDDVWFITDAGVEQYKSAKSQVGLFYESLLPALNIDDLFHAYLGATFPLQEWGTVGGFVNFISFGSIPQTNDDGTVNNNPPTSTEMVAALSYGTKLQPKLGLGVNIKFIYSALNPAGGDDGVAASYAVDLALLWKDVFINSFNIGFVMQNIGPGVFYVERSQSDPLPFTWKIGTSYEVFSSPDWRFIVAADLNREATYREEGNSSAVPVYIGAWKDIINPHGDTPEQRNRSFKDKVSNNFSKMVYNTGAELVYANTVALRTGYLKDPSGEREEIDFGVGVSISDVLDINGAFIRDFGNGVRNGQTRFDLAFKF